MIIECDENQHKYYTKDCIIPRIHRIQEALNRNIIVIMFNPDGYIDENNNLPHFNDRTQIQLYNWIGTQELKYKNKDRMLPLDDINIQERSWNIN